MLALKQGSLRELLFIYRYLKGCHVEEKQTWFCVASECKTRPMRKALRRNILTRHEAEPAERPCKNMMTRDKAALLPVTLAFSGGWAFLSRILCEI